MNTGKKCSPNSPVLTWSEFAECSKRHSCPNCEIGKPERDRDECIRCYEAYIKEQSGVGSRESNQEMRSHAEHGNEIKRGEF
ncbi:MAG: hypothetical protein HY096_09760 [Nitrospinae bacterium]|nr:hypothetical protein [Nitrospinota bacterium]